MNLLKKVSKSQEDPYIALLAHRSEPTTDGLPSPAERVFGRKIGNHLPSFQPIISDKSIVSKLYQNKMKQKLYYDKNAKDLSMLTRGATVCIRQGDKKEWSTKCQRTLKLKLLVTMTHQQQCQFLKMTSWPFQHHSKDLKNIASQGLDV